MKEQCTIERTVLVIEDDEINREILTEILAAQYRVFTAANGKEGRDILKKHGK